MNTVASGMGGNPGSITIVIPAKAGIPFRRAADRV
jgi:hypothetical protein